MSQFTYGGRIKFRQGHLHNDMYLGTTAKMNIWEQASVEELKKQCADGTLDDNYGKNAIMKNSAYYKRVFKCFLETLTERLDFNKLRHYLFLLVL